MLLAAWSSSTAQIGSMSRPRARNASASWLGRLRYSKPNAALHVKYSLQTRFVDTSKWQPSSENDDAGNEAELGRDADHSLGLPIGNGHIRRLYRIAGW